MFKLISDTKKFLLHVLLACWLLVAFHASAQTQNFYFTNYGVKDGMSHGIVDAFMRDSEGFLWIATFNGLDRFDGTNFKVFHADYHNPNAIIDNYVQDICEDHEGNIWCGCEKGVSCYNKSTGKFSNYHLTNPYGFNVNANHVFNILCDRHGTVWCASDAGIFEFDKRRNNFKGYYHSDNDSTSPSSDRVFKNAFIEDPKQDGIWLGGPQGINFLDLKTKKFYSYRNNPHHLPVFFSETIYPLAFDMHQNLWFAIEHKPVLFCYDPISKTLATNKIEISKSSKPIRSVATLFFDSKGNTWFSTWNSKCFYKGREGNSFKQVVHDNSNANSIAGSFLWDIIEAPDGTLWFGTLNGLSKLQVSAQYFSLLKPNESLSANQQFKFINAVFQANDSMLWIGADAGLYSYNLQTQQCKKFINPIPGKSNYVNYIIPVNHRLWLAGLDEINIFDPDNKKFLDTNLLPPEWKLHSQEIGNIHACINGDLWIIANSTSLYQFNKQTGKWLSYKYDTKGVHSIFSGITTAMYEEDNGDMWFGTVENGIIRFDKKQSKFNFFRNASVGSSKIPIEYTIRICKEKKDELYLMLGGYGLMKFNYKDSTAKLYRQSDGLATESNFDMLIDKAHNIWLAGYQEVTAFNPTKNTFKRFRIDYAYDNFDYGNVLMLFKNGDVGVSILDAIAIYKPGILNEEKSLSPVLISDFSVFEKSIPFTQKKPNIHLNYKQNFFSISFSGFLNSKTDLQYAYKLEGFDKDWVYSGKRQIAFYTNVPGGDYTFFVKASASSGQWSTPTVIHIFVSPPFWETYWFRGIVVGVLIFFVIAIFKIRERNYREKQEQKLQVLKVRDRIAQDLHDDIGASLSSIRMYSEAVRMQVKEQLPHADTILERISENSKEIVENMSDIVWAINPKNDSLQFMEDRMHSFISAVCSSKNIIPHFNQIDFHELKLPMEMRKNIFLIFKEAVNNAAKYAECKNIYIDIEKNHGKLVLSIKDDGKGFDIAGAKGGNGLHNMQKRAQELGGEVFIESKAGEETVIKLVVPFNEVYENLPANGE